MPFSAAILGSVSSKSQVDDGISLGLRNTQEDGSQNTLTQQETAPRPAQGPAMVLQWPCIVGNCDSTANGTNGACIPVEVCTIPTDLPRAHGDGKLPRQRRGINLRHGTWRTESLHHVDGVHRLVRGDGHNPSRRPYRHPRRNMAPSSLPWGSTSCDTRPPAPGTASERSSRPLSPRLLDCMYTSQRSPRGQLR
jgi:hypothetical protein